MIRISSKAESLVLMHRASLASKEADCPNLWGRGFGVSMSLETKLHRRRLHYDIPVSCCVGLIECRKVAAETGASYDSSTVSMEVCESPAQATHPVPSA